MLKIGVFSDVHANLPALEAVLAFLEQEACDARYHLGDAIGIGPYPVECMELLLTTPNLNYVMGNHDWWYVDGLPRPRPTWMSDGEIAHQHWVHQQLGNAYRSSVRQWKFAIQEDLAGVRTVFTHYGLKNNQCEFKSIVKNPIGGDLDIVFADFPEDDLIFYGHTHIISHMAGKARFVNPGSVGCTVTPSAPCLIMTVEKGIFELQQFHIPYDDTELLRAFDERNVPERDFLRETFYGGRFPE